MMKTKRIVTSLLLSLLVLLGTVALAQNRDGNKCKDERGQKGPRDRMAYLDLTEDQQASAKTFFTQMKKEMTPLKLDLEEKKVQLEKLMIADQPDEKAIYAKVDELSDIKVQMQKLKIENKLKLRSLLNADQKVLFDAKQSEKGKGKQRNGSNKGQGKR